MAEKAMHKSHNDLKSNAKTVAMGLLNARLADTIDLALAVKQAHWNIKGPQFIGIHEMLDTLRDELDVYVDKMAERVTALGGTALGTTQVVNKASALPPYPTNIYSIRDHLTAVIERCSFAPTRCAKISTMRPKQAMPVQPTCSLRRRGGWISRCGSWRRIHRNRRRCRARTVGGLQSSPPYCDELLSRCQNQK